MQYWCKSHIQKTGLDRTKTCGGGWYSEEETESQQLCRSTGPFVRGLEL